MPKNGQVTIRELELIGQHETKIALLQQDTGNIKISMKEISDSIYKIETNHLTHIQADINDIKIRFAELKPQNRLITKILDLIIMSVVASVIALVLINFK